MADNQQQSNNPKHLQRLGAGLLGGTPTALQAQKPGQLQRQAIQLMRALYKPAFTELSHEGDVAQSVYAKRQSDNQYYLDWLNSQSTALDAHAQAADSTIEQQHQAIQDSAAQAMQELRTRLVSESGNTPGNVSDPNQATAFNILPEAQYAAGLIEGARNNTAAEMSSAAKTRETMSAMNLAAINAAQTKNQGDLATKLSDLDTARKAAVQERAGKTLEELDRLKDQEVTKAQSRVDIRGQEAQLALALKQHRLDKAKLVLDRMVANAQISQAQANAALTAAQQAETHRHNLQSEGTAQQNADTAAQNEQDDASQHQQDQHHDTVQAQHELQHSAVHDIGNLVSTITSRPQLQTMLGSPGGIQKVVKWMQDNHFDPLYAQFAAEYVRDGAQGINGGVKDQLRGLGIDVGNLLGSLG